MRENTNEKSEYYCVEMNNGGFCIKNYKPSELKEALNKRSQILGYTPKYKKIEGRR